MKTNIDTQMLTGFASATAIPVAVQGIIKFAHPALYTLTCGQGYLDGAAACYADDRLEAVLYLLSLVAVAYGWFTMRSRVTSNPTPPEGMKSAVIAAGQVPVVTDRDGTDGLASAKALPGTAAEPQPLTPPN